MSKFTEAMHDPSAVFTVPHEVLQDDSFSLEQKIKVLEQWAYDAKEIEVADSENMLSDSSSMLHRVLECLQEIKE